MKLHVAVALLIGTGWVGGARAQSASSQAEALFRKGKDLLKDGKIAEACAAFDASEKAEPAVTTLLNQADCREKNGQLATAWGEFVDAERQTRTATDQTGKGMHGAAAGKAQKLEPRLSMLTIRVASPVDGETITRDGAPVEAGAWGTALPSDGGAFHVVARAPGHADWSGTVTVTPEGDKQTIDVPALGAVASSPVEARPVAEIGRDEVVTRRSFAVPVIFAAGAVVLAGGAVGFDLWGNSTYDKSKSATNVSTARDLWHSANNKRYVAEGLGIGAVACAGVAIWQFLAVHHTHESGVAIAPSIDGTHAGFVLAGRF